MEVILLERVGKLGHMGDTVRVKDGYARNFLLPRGKALRATEANKKKFESQRAELEARNLELKRDAAEQSPPCSTARASSSSARPARPGSSTARFRRATSPRRSPPPASRSIATMSRCCTRSRRSACTRRPVHLHPEVEAFVTINVARSPEQAERQAKGEDLTVREETSMDDLGLEVGKALAEAGPGESFGAGITARASPRLQASAKRNSLTWRYSSPGPQDAAVKWRRLGESGNACGSRQRPAWAP